MGHRSEPFTITDGEPLAATAFREFSFIKERHTNLCHHHTLPVDGVKQQAKLKLCPKVAFLNLKQKYQFLGKNLLLWQTGLIPHLSVSIGGFFNKGMTTTVLKQ